MNFLAHAYLSFNDPGILLGNMISDFVKGKKKFDYPLVVQNGIMLHRMIDTFTDEHPATHAAKEVFRPHYRLYSGAFVDVAYDHFLALDQGEFPGNGLLIFSHEVYRQLEAQTAWMPAAFAGMFPYMKEQNWLFNYGTRAGIRNSFAGVVRRAAYLNESSTAFALFEEHYQLLEDCYRHFWKELYPFAKTQFELIKTTHQP